MQIHSLEFKKLNPELQMPLEVFFRDIEESGIARYFHPHLFFEANAHRVCEYAGQDIYYVALTGDRILGYGLLRGWDEGYDIPSLGIALHPSVHGQGLGRAFMYFLHAAARQRGALKVRIKVYSDNLPGVNLYVSLGYIFQADEEDGQLVGVLNLV